MPEAFERKGNDSIKQEYILGVRLYGQQAIRALVVGD